MAEAAPPLRLAVLLGGGGSALQALLEASQAGGAPAEVAVVISHRATAGGLHRALEAHLPAIYLPPPVGLRRTPEAMAHYEQRLVALLRPFDVDLVALTGWMLVLSPLFLDAFPQAVLNIHPALLPADGGETVTLSDGRHIPAFRGAHAVQDALAAGVDTTGATVHYAAPAVDRGAVLATGEAPILPGDTPATLHARIKPIEHCLLLRTLAGLALARAAPRARAPLK